MSGKIVWSQASKAATAVSGTKLDSFFRRIHFWRHNAISSRNVQLPAVAATCRHEIADILQLIESGICNEATMQICHDIIH